MRRLIMLSLFQGCLGLSFKIWAGLQDLQLRLLGLNLGGCLDRIELQLTVINYQFIISSDQDLLTMHRFEGIDIVTVKKFAGYRN